MKKTRTRGGRLDQASSLFKDAKKKVLELLKLEDAEKESSSKTDYFSNGFLNEMLFNIWNDMSSSVEDLKDKIAITKIMLNQKKRQLKKKVNQKTKKKNVTNIDIDNHWE
jgi:uncharacterized protein YeeX (DUF496 family)